MCGPFHINTENSVARFKYMACVNNVWKVYRLFLIGIGSVIICGNVLLVSCSHYNHFLVQFFSNLMLLISLM